MHGGGKKWKSEYLQIRAIVPERGYDFQLVKQRRTSTMTIFALSLYAPTVPIFYSPLPPLINWVSLNLLLLIIYFT
jgi:hypothetical protein